MNLTLFFKKKKSTANYLISNLKILFSLHPNLLLTLNHFISYYQILWESDQKVLILKQKMDTLL